MKKIFMFCAMLATLCLFNACEKNQEVSENSIIGKWKCEKAQFCYYDNGQLIRSTIYSDGAEQYFDFQTGGVYFYTIYSPYDGLLMESDTATWKLNGSILTLTSSEKHGVPYTSSQYKVTKLTSTEMQLEHNEKGNWGGFDEYNYVIDYFTKVE